MPYSSTASSAASVPTNATNRRAVSKKSALVWMVSPERTVRQSMTMPCPAETCSACTTWPAIIAIAHARTAAKVGGCSVSRVLKPIAKQSLQLFDAIADGINSLFGATILQIPQTIERFPYVYTAHSNGRAVCARQLVGFGDKRPRFFNEVSATEFDANEISAPRVYRNDFLTG